MKKDNKLTKIISVIAFISIIVSVISSIIPKYRSPFLIYLPFIIISIYVVIIIFSNIFKFTKSKNSNSNIENEIAKNVKNQLDKEKEQSKPIKCNYCGSMYSNESSKCPNCGATKDKN